MNLKQTRVLRLIASLDKAKRAEFEAASARASEVIVIGSSATGTAGKGSDLDVVFIGNGRRLRSPGLDFIWVPEKWLHSQHWLGSELATHIAYFGVWIKGAGAWKKRVFLVTYRLITSANGFWCVSLRFMRRETP